MFNWKKRPKQGDSTNANSRNGGDFMLPEDKEKVIELAEEKEAELEKLAKIDDEILMVQRSTKTLLPFMAPMHNRLRMKYKWYYAWHLKRYADLVHWLMLIALAPVMSLAIFSSIYTQNIPMTKATAAWYDNSWGYRRALTIDHTKVSADLTGFPVEVSLTGLSNINADGTDIRFTSSDGTTELPRQIETYSSGTLVAWVKADLSSSVDTTLYMYYGNAAATEPAADSTYGSQNVWDSNYAAVWHMNADANDSTVNAKNGTDHAISHGASYGVAGGGLNTTSSDSGISIPTTTIGAIGTGDFTIEFWMKPVAPPVSRYVWMAALFNSGASYTGPFMVYDPLNAYSSGNGMCVRLQTTNKKCITSPSASSLYGSWTYVVWNRLSGVNTVYYNSSQVLQFTDNTSITAPSLGHIFGNYSGPPQPWAFNPNANGDEYRISKSGRSVDWITTQYNNQSSPSTFLAAGAEEIPVFAPDAPTIDSVTIGDAQAVVYFSAPANDGGSAITGYTVTSSPGGVTASGSSSPIVVPGLTNGTEYTFTVYATNSIGNSSDSTASDPATPTSVSWYNSSWSYRRAIVVDHTKVPSNQTGFPVEIHTSGLANVNADGTDIRFTSSDGATELPREIEAYSDGDLTAWVKTDLSSTVDTTLYMYYGNAAATEPAANSTYGSQNVWDSNYKGVWHLADSTNPTDSTSNGHNGTNNGTIATTGKIGSGGSFNGSSFINSGTINLSGNSITMQAWVNASSFQSSWPYISSIMGTEYGSNVALFRLGDAGLSNNLLQTGFGLSGNTNAINGMDTSTWYLVTATADGSNLKIYLNTNQENSSGQSGAIVSNADFNIGSNSSSGGRYFSGIMDEITVATTARSGDWITTQYNNQNSPATFLTVVSEQAVPVAAATVSGTIYTSLDKSTRIGAGKTVKLSINGDAAESTTTDADGAFSFSTSALDTDYPVAVYLSGDTSKASYITIATDGSTDITGLELYTSHISLSQQNSTVMTNALLATANTIADTDMLVSTSAGVTTFAATSTMMIVTGKTYTPGGNVNMGSLLLNGTFNPAANTITVSGDWTNNGGTFTYATSTVDFTGNAAINGPADVPNSFYNLKCAHDGKTVTFGNTSTSLHRVYNIFYAYSGGTLAGDSQYLYFYKSDGDPFVDTGATITGLIINYMSSASINISGHAFAAVSFRQTSNNVTYTLTSSLSATGHISVYSSTSGKVAALDTSTFDVTGGGDFLILNAAIDFGSGSHSFTGKLYSNSATANSTVNFNSANVSVAGNLDFTGITVTPGTSTVTMNSTAAGRTITSSGQSFNNLTFNGSGGGWTLADDLTVTGALNITTGILDASSYTINLTGSGTPMTVAGTFTPSTGTVNYTGSSATNVAGTAYHNLTVNHADTTFTAAGNITVSNVLTITAGTFDASSRTITLSGSSGTPFTSSGTFTPSTSTVVFNTDTVNIPFSGISAFYNLTLSPTLTADRAWTLPTMSVNGTSATSFDINPTASSTHSLTLTLAGDLTLPSSGTLLARGTSSATSILNTSTDNHAIATGKLQISPGGSVVANGSTITLSGTATPFAYYTSNAFTAGTSTIVFNADADVSYLFYLHNGNLTVNNVQISPTITAQHTQALNSYNYTLTISGTLVINPSSDSANLLTINNSKSVSVSGSTTIGSSGSASSTFGISASSTFGGVIINSGCTMIPTASISVSSMTIDSGGTLTLNSNTLTISGVGTAFVIGGTFNAGSASTVTYTGSSATDVAATDYCKLVLNHTDTTFTAAGNITVSNVLTITAGTFDASDKTITLSGTSGTPFVRTGTFIPSTSTVTVTGNNASGNTALPGGEYYNLTLNNSSETFTLASALTVNNDLNITAGTFAPGQDISIYGSWTNAGSFTPGTNTVNFVATATGKTITSNAQHFYNIIFNGTGGGWTLTDDTTIENDITLTTGTVAAGATTLTVAGDWSASDNATFTYGTSTVDLTGDATITTPTIGQYFYNLKTAHDGKTINTGRLHIENYLYTYSGGTINDSGDYIYLYKSDDDPIIDTGATLNIFPQYTSTADLNIAGHTFSSVFFRSNTNNVTYTLTSDLATTTGVIGVFSNTDTKITTLNADTHNITSASDIYTGISNQYSGSLNFGSGSSTIAGSIYASYPHSGNSINFGSASVSVGASINFTNITVTPGTSTVTMNSTAAGRTITSSGQSFNNLTFNGSGGGWTLADDLTVTGALNITTGILDASSYTINLTGSGTPMTVAGTFTPSTSTVNYTGSSATNVAGTAYHNLTVNHVSTAFTASSAITVGGTLTITNGTLTLSAANTIAATVLSAGQLNINNAGALGSGTFTIAGGKIDNTSAGDITLSANNTQNWNGSFTFVGTRSINLGTGAVTLGADISVGSGSWNYKTLTVGGIISGSHSLTHSSGYADYLALAGANTFSGPLYANNNVRLSGTYGGSIEINGVFSFHNSGSALSGTGQTVTLNNGGTLNFYHTAATALGDESNSLVINGGKLVNASSVTITGNNPQYWNGSFATGDTYTYGSLTLGSGPITLGNNITITCNYSTNYSYNTSLIINGAISGDYSLTKAGTEYLTLNGTNTYTGGTTVSAGTLKIGSSSALGTGDITISGGTLDTNSSDLTISGTTSISSGVFTGSTGSVDLNGDLNLSGGTLTAPSGNFTVSGNWNKTGGTFTPGSNTITFDTTTAGKTITSDGQSFNNLIFNGSGGGWTLADDLNVDGYMTLTAGTLDGSNKTLTIGGNWTNNGGTFTYSTSTVDFTNSSFIDGTNAFYNLKVAHDGKTISCQQTVIYNNLYTYSGGTFNSSNNLVYLYKSDGDPIVDTGATINISANYMSSASISVAGHAFTSVDYRAQTNNVAYTLTSDLTTTGTGNYGFVEVYSNTAGKTATLSTGDHNIIAGGKFYVGVSGYYGGAVDFGSGTHSIGGDLKSTYTGTNTINFNSANVSVAGNLDFTNLTVTPGTSTITLTATDSDNTITSANQSFNNLTFNGTNGDWTLQDDLTVNGILNINNGTFNASDKTINLAGSGTPLVVTGTFTENTSTVSYTGSTATNVAGTTYHSLTLNHAGVTFTATGNITAKNALTVSAGTLNGSDKTITLEGPNTPLVVNGTFTPGTGTVIFAGGNSTTQTIPGGLTFNNLTATTSGNTVGRTLQFTGSSTTTVSGALTLTGAVSKTLTVQSSDTTDYTVNPTTASVSYLDVSHFTNSGSQFCATYSTDSGNNLGFIINADATCPLPTAPTGFAGTAASTSQINWSWTDNASNETSYQVQDGSSNNLSGSLAANTASWNETGLSVNTAYTRKSVVYNVVGGSSSSLATVYTLANAPSAPTLSAVSANSINIVINTNSNPAAATRYAIYNQTLSAYVKNADGSTQADPDWQLYADWGGASGFDNVGLTAGTNYVYKVKAENGDDIATAFSSTANTNTSNPTIAFTSATASGSISTAAVTVSVSLAEVSGTDATVDYAVSGGTAVAGTDFTLTDGTASITHGNTSTSFDITITNDHLVGSDKTIIVSLSNPSDSSLGANSTYTYTIVNDNPSPSGGFVINSTNPSRTNSRSLTLTLSYSLATQYKAASDSSFTDASWASVASSASYNLADTDGTQTVYLKYKDQYGNESSTYNRSIVLDRLATAAPTALSVSAGNSAISLTWTNPDDADFSTIRIYRSTTSDFTPGSSNLLTTTTSSSTATYTDSTVENNVEYFYKVAALDTTGNLSDASSQASGKPDSDQPTTPGQPTVSTTVNTIGSALVANTKAVTFSWDKSTDENSGVKAYYINIGTVSGTANVLDSQQVDQPTTSYSHTFAADGTYYIRVYARDNKNNLSAASSETTLIIDSTAPTAPAELTMFDVSNRAEDYYAVILSWKPSTDDGSDLKGYVISRNNQALNLSDGITSDVSTDSKSGLISYLDVLSADTKASYTVKALDNAKNETTAVNATLSDTSMTRTTGQKAGSTEISLQSSIIGEGQLALSDIKVSSSATTNDTTQAEVTWATSVPANSQVAYGTSANYNLKTELDTGLNSSHTIILSDLKPATTYHFKVTSIDQHSNTVSSGDQTFTTSGQIKQKTVLEIIADYISNFFSNVYNAVKKVFTLGSSDKAMAADQTGPKSMYVTNISTSSQPGYAIYWPSNLGQVSIERSENGGGFSGIATTAKNYYVDTEVKADSTYTYRIGSLVASVSDAMSGKSVISDIKIKAGVVDKNSASVIVTFKTDKLAQSQILYGENGVMNNKTTLDDSLNQSHTVLIKKLKVNSAYSFILRAIDSSGANTTDSPIQKLVTPKAPVDMSLFEIIINALESAFAGLGKIGK